MKPGPVHAAAPRQWPGASTQAALALAELCYNTLIEEGEKAMLAAEQHVVTPALEKVIEANTYLSGVGFESGGWRQRMRSITALPPFRTRITTITVKRSPSGH